MKALLVGLGGIGQRHARNLRMLLGDQLELTAFRTRRLQHVISPQLEIDTTASVEEVYGITAFDDLAVALARKPDVAVIANPSSLHIETAIACARAGCHLFIEKPLSVSEASVDELIGIVESNNLIATVGYQLRFHPCFERFAQIIAGDELGALLAVNAMLGEYLPGWHRYEDYRQMYAARAELGGGVVLSQIHEYDYLYALFGMPERLFAVGGRFSTLEIDVEDTVSVLMECTVARRPLPVHIHQDFVQRPSRRTCEAIGERGRAVMDFVGMTVTLQQPDEPEKAESFAGFDRNELFLRELRSFLDAVRRESPPLVGLRDAFASLRIALAVKASIARRSAISLAELTHAG